MTIMEIVEQAKTLSPAERKELVKLLVDTLDIPPTSPTYNILEFEGIAAHLADDEDPQTYLNRMREEWDQRP